MSDEYTNYWGKRKALRYYAEVRALVRKHAPEAKTLLDVGAGPTLYLNEYNIWDIVAVDKEQWPIHKLLQNHIHIVQQPFEEYHAPRTFDVVQCLQTLEHIAEEHKPAFVANLRKHCEGILVVSLPFRWTAAQTRWKNHIGIDEATIKRWIGEDPMDSSIVTENSGGKRIINVYRVNHAENR